MSEELTFFELEISRLMPISIPSVETEPEPVYGLPVWLWTEDLMLKMILKLLWSMAISVSDLEELKVETEAFSRWSDHRTLSTVIWSQAWRPNLRSKVDPNVECQLASLDLTSLTWSEVQGVSVMNVHFHDCPEFIQTLTLSSLSSRMLILSSLVLSEFTWLTPIPPIVFGWKIWLLHWSLLLSQG